MSLILCIETSAKVCSVAISEDGSCKSYLKSENLMHHGKEITVLIEKCLKSCNLSITQLDGVALSSGPGSYTGLRVASSCAKGICFALDIPLIAIDTLSVLAYSQLIDKKAFEVAYYIPMVDARRDEVYYCVFDKNLVRVEQIDNQILKKDSFIDFANITICGDGAHKAQQIMEHPSANYFGGPALAQDMVALSFKYYKEKKFEDLAYFNPIYHKSPNITQSKKPLF